MSMSRTLVALLWPASFLLAQDPPADPPIPATDGRHCSSSQYHGRLGAGSSVIGDGFETNFVVQDILSGESFAFAGPDDPDFLAVPSAGDPEGTVNALGDLFVRLDLVDLPSINGYPFDLMLLYRTNRAAAAADLGWTSHTSATPDLSVDWNLSVVDRVVLVETTTLTGPSSYLKYTSGGGSLGVANPITAPSGVSGQFWAMDNGFSIFRKHTYSSVEVLDRHRPDGSVMRYELVNGAWRPKVFYDPFDNAYSYAWGSSGELDSITDDRGGRIEFDWTSTQLTIRRWMGSSQATDLTETISLSSGRVEGYTGPTTSYVDTLSAGIFDLATTSSNGRSKDIDYNVNGLLESIEDVRTGLNELTVTYASYAPYYRVSLQTDMHGGTHAFGYSWSGGLLTSTYTDPLGNQYAFALNADGYPTSYTVTPHATNGRPRAAASDTAEPTSLQWTFTYSGCGCGQLASITYPTGLSYSLTHDANGNLTNWSTLNPTGSGTVAYAWTYDTFERGNRLLTSSPPGSPVTNASVTYSYDWVSRSFGIWGEKPSEVTIATSSITLVGGGSQVLVSSQALDSKGRPTETVDTAGSYTDYVYKATGAGAGLLERIERRAVGGLGTQKTLFTQDDYGRVTNIKEGTDSNYAETAFTIDALGRAVTQTVTPGASQPSMVTTIYRDAHGNVAVVLNNNLDYTGIGPKYADGTGSPRSSVRSEYHYHFDRLLEVLMDRRPLPDADDTASPTSGSNPWMIRTELDYDYLGRVVQVTAPNGAVTSYVWDGYGTLYKAIGDEGTGGINQDLGKYYFDSDLVVHQRKVPAKVGGSTATAVSTYTRNHSGKGYITTIAYPDGIQQVRSFDSMHRAIRSEVFDAGSVRRKLVEADFDEVGRVVRSRQWLLDGTGTISGASAETEFVYNVRSQVTEVRAPLGRKAFRVYDDYGRLKSTHDNLSTSSSGWNEVELTYMTGRDLVVAAVSKIFEESDDASPPAGTRKEYRTEFEYDLLGRTLKTRREGLVGSSATALESTYAYNSLGSLVYTQEPQQQGDANKFTRAVFDAAGRWVQVVKKASSTDQIVLRSEYVDYQSTSKETEVKRYDGRGFVTRSQFDALYRVQNHYRPGYTTGAAHKTLVQYDVGSMVDRVVDGNANEILYSRDISGRVLQRNVTLGFFVSPMATREVFEYDGIGRLASMATDAYSSPHPRVVDVDFTYDSLDRVLNEQFVYYGITSGNDFDVTSAYTYSGSQPLGDPSFRRNVTYPSGMAVATEPDSIGRLEEVKLTPVGGSQFTLSKYRYAGGDVLHRKTWLGSSGSTVVDTSVGFDDHGRLGSLQHKIGSSTPFDKFSYTWDGAGDLIRKKREIGTTTAGQLFQYDGYHRLTGAKHGVPIAQADGTYTAATSYAKEVLYTLDPGQNRDQVVVNAGGTSTVSDYTTESDSPRYSTAEGFTPLYDGEGNMVFDGLHLYMYDFRNRLSEVYGVYPTSSSSSSSALSGTEESRSTGTSERRLTPQRARRVRVGDLALGRQELFNRARGNLVDYAKRERSSTTALRSSAITASGDGGGGAEEEPPTFEVVLEGVYGYDPFNRRVLRLDAEGDIRYAYDGWREVEELAINGSGVVSDRKDTVWGHGLGEILAYYKKTSGSWTGYFPFQDEQGSVIQLLDGSGSTVEEVHYDSYGKASYYWTGTAGVQAKSSVGNPWSFATGRLDNTTGLLYLRNRYLKTEFGRFCTIDPVGGWVDRLGLGNGYQYAGNEPVAHTDSLGLLSVASGRSDGMSLPSGTVENAGDWNLPPQLEPRLAGDLLSHALCSCCVMPLTYVVLPNLSWCVYHCIWHGIITLTAGRGASAVTSVLWEALEFFTFKPPLPKSEHVIDVLVCDRFGELLAQGGIVQVLLGCRHLKNVPDHLGW
jgi:RHS repeat-associated protein